MSTHKHTTIILELKPDDTARCPHCNEEQNDAAIDYVNQSAAWRPEAEECVVCDKTFWAWGRDPVKFATKKPPATGERVNE